MAYSLDLRQRVVAATNQSMSIRQAATVFLVSTATIERWRRRARETGDLRPQPIPGRPRLIGDADLPRFDAQLIAYPAVTLTEHCRCWQEQIAATFRWKFRSSETKTSATHENCS